ncbi:MAG: aminopeptidase P N-terminal domain-containing protein [Phycisphaerae bacterium]|nr:aminopeptidase P N-terminal domain-containing protein [Phycisphaerae bacterium]
MDQKLLDARRDRLARSLELKDELLLVGAGEPVHIPGGQDQTYPFMTHQEYFYLTDRECEGGVVAYDPKDGWTDFVPTVTQAQRVWEGREQAPGTPLPELAGWLAARRGRPIVALGAPITGLRADTPRTADVRERFTHARRPKDAAEVERMRRAAAATAPAYAAARRLLAEAARPGGATLTEHRLKVEIEAEFGRHGATRSAYGTIVGFGSNAAVLHFEPSTRAAKPGDLALIDAGAEIDRYAADVTRTLACGEADGARRELHAIVLRAEERACARCVVGAEWIDVHLAAATDMAEGLVQMGVLRGSAAAAVESGAMGLFFPHGLGHLIGLGVRDASGREPGRAARARKGVVTIRCDLPLGAGYCITVEPGVYFIASLLNDAANRATHRDAVNWAMVDGLLAAGIGGVRIEDNIHVTADGPENLTAMIPKGLG